MAKKNTDTVPAMLTPGEFVIKKKSAKKIGYGKLNQMNKTGKVNTKKEAKMPQGKGTYGSQKGRPAKKAKKMQIGGKVPGAAPLSPIFSAFLTFTFASRALCSSTNFGKTRSPLD